MDLTNFISISVENCTTSIKDLNAWCVIGGSLNENVCETYVFIATEAAANVQNCTNNQLYGILSMSRYCLYENTVLRILTTLWYVLNSERSDECIDFTMSCGFFFLCVSVYSITSRDNASISNFGDGFR
ncbi:Uncharacterized protein FWK35_00003940 [Aphis craccivora]|uniref:Uncharacterized protein n=1 Tax=Aphis craccivora TaxID=307492 RepID=A0A6G0ZHV3_APHCR|nr:Uncharacterized protein FWK35_00003940 [Aphis craccivora]